MSKCGEVARSEPDVLSIMGKGRRDRQRALFSKFFFFENFISDCAGLRIFSSAMRGFLGAMGQTRPAWREAVPASITGLHPSPFPTSIAITIAATHLSYI